MHTRHSAGRFLGILLAVSFLSACDHDGRFERGPQHTETRDVGAFDAVDMDGAGRLQITVGGPVSLTLEGRQSMLEDTRTEVRGHTLYIRSKRKDWLLFGGSQRVDVRITVPSLESLDLDGGNDVRLSGFNGGDSRIKVQGATHLEADGRLNELTVYMAGAGHADLSKLVTNDAKVMVDGVGSVYVNSQKSLDATMNGVGAILYTGNPQSVNTSMNGLGTIAQREPDEMNEHEHSKRRDDRGDRRSKDELQPEYERGNDRGHKEAAGNFSGGLTEVI